MRRVQLGHNRTLLHELEEGDIASFKNYLRMDPDTINTILGRITPRIKKLTTNYKEPIPARRKRAATQKNCGLSFDFEDRRLLLAEWLELASKYLFSWETAGIGCLNLEYCFLFFISASAALFVRIPVRDGM